jgi:chloride channel protein, CIC family
MRLYPPGAAPWRRLLFPVVGSLGIGYLLFRYFPNARGSGVPQTKAALYAREGRILLRTVLGKFFCTSATLASGIPSDAKDLPFKLVRALLQCSDVSWDCVPKR